MSATSKHLAPLLATLLATSQAGAEPASSWSILGPAASFHASSQAAPIRAPGGDVWTCQARDYSQPAAPVLATFEGGAEAVKASRDWTVKNSGGRPLLLSACTFSRQPAARGWYSNNPAIGLERSTTDDAGRTRSLYVTLVRDSFGVPSLMAGGAVHWPVLQAGRVTVSAGAAGGAWWRTYEQGEGRRLVPYLFPSLTIADRSGVSLNVAYAPRLALNGRTYVTTDTMMLQTAWTLD